MPGRKPANGRSGETGTKDGASDLFHLIIAYAKQETLDPVVGQLKALGTGLAGAVLLALGTVLLALGFVRALQSEFGGGSSARLGTSFTRLPAAYRTEPAYGASGHLSGDWSWVPYMGGTLFCLAVAGFCATRILKGVRR